MAAVEYSKTLSCAARIVRADNGSEVALCDLEDCPELPAVWSLYERLRLVARPLTVARHVGEAEVFSIHLASFRKVEATADSEFRGRDATASVREP